MQTSTAARNSTAADAEIRTLRTRLRETQEGSRVALATAAATTDRAIQERNALAHAMAALTRQAVSTPPLTMGAPLHNAPPLCLF